MQITFNKLIALVLLNCTCLHASSTEKGFWPCVLTETINGAYMHTKEKININRAIAIAIDHKIIGVHRADTANVEMTCNIDGVTQTISRMTATNGKLTCSGLLPYFQPEKTVLSQYYVDCYTTDLPTVASYGAQYFQISADTMKFPELVSEAHCVLLFRGSASPIEGTSCSLNFTVFIILYLLLVC